MGKELIWITSEAGQQLEYVIERLSDGTCYRPTDRSWQKQSDITTSARMGEASPGHYGAELPDLDGGLHHCVNVFDVATRRLAICKPIGWPRTGFGYGTAYAQGDVLYPGSTVQGDVLRSEGVAYKGAAIFFLNAAKGRSIDADTAMQWNEYVHRS